MPVVAAISDLHGVLPRAKDGWPDVPDCDLLIVAGDICPDFLNSSYDKGEARQAAWLGKDFREWLFDVKHARGRPEIIGIAGNHDFVFERGIHPDLPWRYVRDRLVTAAGLLVYGTPWCPKLGRWAFYADEKRLRYVYEAVPPNVDVLVSHSPPYNYGDVVPKNSRFNMSDRDIHVGTHQLTNILYEKKPHVVVSGHIHGGRGRYEYHSNGTVVYNVALLTDDYEPWDLPSATLIPELA